LAQVVADMGLKKKGRPSTGKWTAEYRREYMRKYRQKQEVKDYQRKYHYSYMRKPRDDWSDPKRVLERMWWDQYTEDCEICKDPLTKLTDEDNSNDR
jgi:hypothetical protein